MLNAKKLREDIQNLADRGEAIIALAKEADRDLTEEEQSEVVAIYGDGEENTGQLGDLEAKLKQAEHIESRQKSIAAQRAVANGLGDDNPDEPDRVKIPAKAKRHASLKCFTGNDGERDAFMSGHFFAATLFGNKRSREWCDNHGVDVVNTMIERDNESGGLFVPTETETAIIRQVENHGVARRYCQVTAMSSDVKRQPVRVSGLTAYAVGETGAGTESEPTYKNVELVARKWKVLTKISDDLNEDTLISLADQITLETALAFASSEDDALFNGDGTSTYHGIVGLKNQLKAGTVHDAATGNTAFSTLDLQDFIDALGKLPDYEGMMPAWFISKPGYYASMMRLEQAAGGNTQADIINGNRQFTFLGYPVVWSQKLNKTLTAQTETILAYVGDMSMTALFGDRRGVAMSVTDQRYWENDTIGIKSTERFDIDVFSDGDASNAGPMVAIKTPSS